MKAGMRTRRKPQSVVLLCVALVILNISRAAVARETSEQDAELGSSSKSREDGAAVQQPWAGDSPARPVVEQAVERGCARGARGGGDGGGRACRDHRLPASTAP